LGFRYITYNDRMLNFIFKLLTIYLFFATPFFAGWIANGGKREDVAIPIVGSLIFSVVLFLFLFFSNNI